MHKGTRLVISGSLPSLNEYIRAERSNRYQAAHLKKTTQEHIRLALMAQCRHLHFDRPVKLTFVWTVPNKKKDKDNIAFAKKFIQDALVEMGVLQNDGWNDIESFADIFRIGDPKVEVYIE